MKIKWFYFAKQDFRQILKNAKRLFGKNTAFKINYKIRQRVDLLGNHPYLGKPEPLLSHRKETWRSLVVHRHMKVIYRIGQASVNIAALWDTRQRPDLLKKYIDSLVKADPTLLNEKQQSYRRIKTQIEVK